MTFSFAFSPANQGSGLMSGRSVNWEARSNKRSRWHPPNTHSPAISRKQTSDIVLELKKKKGGNFNRKIPQNSWMCWCVDVCVRMCVCVNNGCKVRSNIVGQVTAGTGQRDKEQASHAKTFLKHLTDPSPCNICLNNLCRLCYQSLRLMILQCVWQMLCDVWWNKPIH